MSLQQPLSATEQRRLHEILAVDDDLERGVSGIEELHGFVTAALCAPSPALPGDCVADVFGDREWTSGNEVREAMELFVRFYSQANEALQNGTFQPLVETKNPASWCLGFVHGMGLRREAWLALERDALRDAMLPILTLAARTTDKDLDAWVSTREEKLLEALPAAVMMIYAATRAD